MAKITDNIIRSLSTPQSFERGRDLSQSGAIFEAQRQDDVLLAKCEGSGAPYYELRCEIDEGGVRSAQCCCPYDIGGLCKHLVALLLTFIHNPNDFAERKPVAELLKDMERATLIELLSGLVESDARLYNQLEMAVTLSKAEKTDKAVTRKKRKTVVSEQVYRRQAEDILNTLRGYRLSEAYWMMGGMVRELRQVRDIAYQFLEAGDPDSALTILMTLLQETADSYDQFDDSDGELGEFLGELGQVLAEVFLCLDLTPNERSALQKRLSPIVDELVDYGIDDIEIAMLALEYGWGAIKSGEHWDDEEGYFDDLTIVKLNVLNRQGSVDEYLNLCRSSGEYRRLVLKLLELGRKGEAMKVALEDLVNAEDCLAVVQRLREQGYVLESITIGERGLDLAGRKHELGLWLGPQEETQGRIQQALDAYLAAFNSLPSLELYQTLQRLAGLDWGKLKPELITFLKSTCYSNVLADVYLFEGEWDSAIQVADAVNWDYRLLEKVVEVVMPHRPEWVIQVCLLQSDQLIAKTQSKYYGIAAAWLQRAKRAYSTVGKQSEWQTYLSALKVQYSRRPALQTELRKL